MDGSGVGSVCINFKFEQSFAEEDPDFQAFICILYRMYLPVRVDQPSLQRSPGARARSSRSCLVLSSLLSRVACEIFTRFIASYLRQVRRLFTMPSNRTLLVVSVASAILVASFGMVTAV